APRVLQQFDRLPAARDRALQVRQHLLGRLGGRGDPQQPGVPHPAERRRRLLRRRRGEVLRPLRLARVPDRVQGGGLEPHRRRDQSRRRRPLTPLHERGGPLWPTTRSTGTPSTHCPHATSWRGSPTSPTPSPPRSPRNASASSAVPPSGKPPRGRGAPSPAPPQNSASTGAESDSSGPSTRHTT